MTGAPARVRRFASSFGITQGARKCCNPVAISMRAAVRHWARAMGGETDVGLLSRRSRPYWVHRADTRPEATSFTRVRLDDRLIVGWELVAYELSHDVDPKILLYLLLL